MKSENKKYRIGLKKSTAISNLDTIESHLLSKILINGVTVKQYGELTSDMFKQIFMIKDIIAN